jgi:hypothetical protein
MSAIAVNRVIIFILVVVRTCRIPILPAYLNARLHVLRQHHDYVNTEFGDICSCVNHLSVLYVVLPKLTKTWAWVEPG